MYFSHHVLCDRREGQSNQERYEQQLAEVRLMDQLGYWAGWFAEHHFAGFGDMAWVSGCTATGPNGTVAGRGDAYTQTARAIRTMAEALAGLGHGHVVKTGVYLADMGQWEAAHREAIGEVRPPCTWVECGTMIHPDMLVEIDAVAVE